LSTPDEVFQFETPETLIEVSTPLKCKKRSRAAGKREATKPDQVQAPVVELSNESGDDLCPAPDPSSDMGAGFEDFLDPGELFITTPEDRRRGSFPKGSTPSPQTAAVDEFEFVKEESCGGPYERNKTMSGFQLAKEQAVEEALLRGVEAPWKQVEVDLNIRGCAQLAHPVMDKTGALVTPAIQIYQLLVT
jgi:hypothetical protein